MDWRRIGRTGFLWLALLAVAAAALPTGSVASASPSDGLVPEAEWVARQDDYLAHATSAPLVPSSPLSIMSHAERGRRDSAFDASAVAQVRPEDFSAIFEKLAAFEDTGDFDVNNLLTLILRYRDELDPGLVEAVEQRILAFKYWWDEPTPEGVVDSQYYWTENHLIIFLANEYVAGQAYPDSVFANSGMTGAEHVAHADPRIRRWFELRSRFGFSEWLSNVYWTEDLKGVLLLAEFAGDESIRNLADMTLDVMLVELASHLQQGAFGSTHGRSYMKDKLTSLDEDTFSLAKMVFDDTDRPYPHVDDATLLAIARRYRPPEVVRRIASTETTGTVRQRQSLPLDPLEPLRPDPEPVYGLPYTGEEGLMTWWSMGAFMAWQIAAFSARFVEENDLWKSSNFAPVAILEPIAENSPPSFIRMLARTLAPVVNAGLLSQVDTSTWRSPEVMLSAAQDWRPGQRSEQAHIWQATLDADALVFTNHPRDGVPPSADPNSKEGYWTGEASIPRVAHHERSLVAIYSPQYPSLPIGSGGFGFGYEGYTHAFFPTERFDEVVERNGWVVGRLGDGYVALWSWRPARWRTYNPLVEHTRGLEGQFDLVARGGPDNVWISEVARAQDFPGSTDPFGDFLEAVSSIRPDVIPWSGTRPCPRNPWVPSSFFCIHLPWDGFTVEYTSPTSGEVRFGWTPRAGRDVPFVVSGSEIDLHPGSMRWDSPWAHAGWDTRTYRAALDGWSLDLDFVTEQRSAGGP
ncbi:MAG: hypothetical protein DYH08_04750 [Actinobacteria bacterium ATB1]|nr:hypothetical protein [Actinobacteria bacterium ATB1]